MDAGFHGARGYAGDGGDFADRKLLEKMQRQHLPMIGRKLRERILKIGIYKRREIGQDTQIQIFRIALFGPVAYAIMPDPINDEAMRELVKPGANGGRFFQFSERPEGPDPEFLKEFESFVPIANELHEVTEQRPLQLGDKGFEGVGLGGLAAKRQPFVANSPSRIHFDKYVEREGAPVQPGRMGLFRAVEGEGHDAVVGERIVEESAAS
jgi:hypothetical protein